MTTTATVTTQLTDWVAQHGVYAVFVLMAIDALLPVGGELVMLYAGVVAAGAVSKATVRVRDQPCERFRELRRARARRIVRLPGSARSSGGASALVVGAP